MENSQYKEHADLLYHSQRKREAIAPLSEINSKLNTVDAYKIQLINVDRELKKGSLISGKKIGLTSRAMQEMFSVNEPDYGHIFSHQQVIKEVDASMFIAPRVEGEIAFILKEDIKGPGVTAKQVIDKTDYVVASLEIVDSRIADWKIQLVDTIADNASFGAYVLSEKRVNPKEVDLIDITMDFYKNGEHINSGSGQDVLGNPATCVAWLANKMSEFDITLHKGEVILSGAFSAALDAKKGDMFEAKFTDLGNVSVRFK